MNNYCDRFNFLQMVWEKDNLYMYLNYFIFIQFLNHLNIHLSSKLYFNFCLIHHPYQFFPILENYFKINFLQTLPLY